jgi:hypothetical protein
MHKKNIVALSVLALVLTAGIALAQESAEVYADIPMTRISMVVPEGFSLVPGFPGMSRADRGSSIVITEVPGPYVDVLDSFTQGVGTDRSMHMVNSEDAKVGQREAKLMIISRNENGTEFHNWLLLFGSDKATVMITATMPASAEGEMAPILKAAMLGAKWNPEKIIDQFSGLEFKIKLHDDFEVRGRRPGGVLVTRKEAGEEITPGEPILLVYPSEETSAPPIEKFAHDELNANQQFKDMKTVEEHALRVKDMAAYEITAEAKVDADQEIPVRIYLLAVRTPNKDMVVEGFVSPEGWDQYLPVFRAMAASYEVTPVPGRKQ